MKVKITATMDHGRGDTVQGDCPDHCYMEWSSDLTFGEFVDLGKKIGMCMDRRGKKSIPRAWKKAPHNLGNVKPYPEDEEDEDDDEDEKGKSIPVSPPCKPIPASPPCKAGSFPPYNLEE